MMKPSARISRDSLPRTGDVPDVWGGTGGWLGKGGVDIDEEAIVYAMNS
jgi:hypothetical protein